MKTKNFINITFISTILFILVLSIVSSMVYAEEEC